MPNDELPIPALPIAVRGNGPPIEEDAADMGELCAELDELLVRVIEGESILREKLVAVKLGDPLTGKEEASVEYGPILDEVEAEVNPPPLTELTVLENVTDAKVLLEVITKFSGLFDVRSIERVAESRGLIAKSTDRDDDEESSDLDTTGGMLVVDKGKLEVVTVIWG